MPRNHISTSFTFSKVLRLALVVVFAVGFMAVIAWPSGAFSVAGGKNNLLPIERVTLAQSSEPVLSVGSAPVTFSGGPFFVPNPTDQVDGVPTCDGTLPCSDFILNVNVPAGYDDQHYVKIQVNWTNPAAQFDLFVYILNGDGSLGKLQAANFFAVNPDVVTISAVSGKYLLRVSPPIPLGDSYTGLVTLDQKVVPAVQGGISTPTFQNFQAPSGLGNGSGEPSIGFALATAQNPQGRAMYQSGTQMLRVTFNDLVSPGQALWESKSAPNAPGSLDPILFTDRQTGRTFTSQLAGACSKAAYTDTSSPFNDGDTWVPSQGCGFPAGIDHQTIGNFPTATARQALVFSEDNGVTWSQPRLVPDSNPAPGIVNPSIGIGANGTIYYGYANSNGAPSIAVGRKINHQISWGASKD